MELSILIAKILGATYLAIGLGMLFDKAYYKKSFPKMLDEAGTMYMGGFMALIGGVLLVTYHNEWVKSWEVIITIIGWLALVKGVALLTFPSASLRFYKPMLKGDAVLTWGALFIVLLGLALGYYGYIA